MEFVSFKTLGRIGFTETMDSLKYFIGKSLYLHWTPYWEEEVGLFHNELGYLGIKINGIENIEKFIKISLIKEVIE